MSEPTIDTLQAQQEAKQWQDAYAHAVSELKLMHEENVGLCNAHNKLAEVINNTWTVCRSSLPETAKIEKIKQLIYDFRNTKG